MLQAGGSWGLLTYSQFFVTYELAQLATLFVTDKPFQTMEINLFFVIKLIILFIGQIRKLQKRSGENKNFLLPQPITSHALVLVTVCHFHPSLIFSNWVGVYSNEARFETPETLGLSNTIAYYRAAMITTPKSLDYSPV